MLQDYKLRIRMLLRYPGLTLAGGLALASAIGIGAGWYDLSASSWRRRFHPPKATASSWQSRENWDDRLMAGRVIQHLRQQLGVPPL